MCLCNAPRFIIISYYRKTLCFLTKVDNTHASDYRGIILNIKCGKHLKIEKALYKHKNNAVQKQSLYLESYYSLGHMIGNHINQPEKDISHLLRTSSVSATLLSVLHVLAHLILTMISLDWHRYFASAGADITEVT